MADNNIRLRSPFADLAREGLPKLDTSIAEIPDLRGARAGAGVRNQQAAPSATTGGLLPPADFRPSFEAVATEYGVPVNVLMALAQQESSYRADAIGPDTKYGNAGGMFQYLESTAKGLGIDRMDPEQSMRAAAQQIRERLDKGYSMEDAVKEHFAGPSRSQWGPQTDQYGRDVMAKARRIGEALLSEDAGRYGAFASRGAAVEQAAPEQAAPAAAGQGQQESYTPEPEPVGVQPGGPELRTWEPTFWDRVAQFFSTPNRDAAAVESAARRIAEEQGISVNEVYRLAGGRRTFRADPEGRGFGEAVRQGWQTAGYEAARAGEEAKPVAADDQGFLSRAGDALPAGYDNMIDTMAVSRFALGGGNTDALAVGLADKIQQNRERAAGRTRGELENQAAFDAVSDSTGMIETLGSALRALGIAGSNPKDTAVGVVEQAPNMLPPMAGGAAGAAIGGGIGSQVAGVGAVPGAIAGGRAGMYIGTAAIELGAEIEQSIIEHLDKNGLEPTAENIKPILQDEAFMDEARAQGLRKGLTLAAVDQLFMGLSGRVAATPMRQATREAIETGAEVATPSLGRRAAYGAAATGIESVGEGASEAAGQFAATGEIDVGEALQEGVYGFGSAVAGATIGGAMETARARYEASPRSRQRNAAREMERAIDEAQFSESADAAARRALDPSNAQYGAAPVDAAPSGPIGRALEVGRTVAQERAAQAVLAESEAGERAAEQEVQAQASGQRVTVAAEDGAIEGVLESYTDDGQGGFSARVVTDDGMTYDFTQDDGVAIAPVEAQQQAVATEEAMAAAAEQAVMEGQQEATAAPAPAEPAAATPVEGYEYRSDGNPFASPEVAQRAAKNRRLQGYEPVEVDGGWALAPVAEAQQSEAVQAKLFEKPQEMNLVRNGNGGVDIQASVEALGPVPDGYTRLYRASSPTVKFEDVFSADGLEDFQRGDLEGVRYTNDPAYADYFRSSYGPDAKIDVFDVRTEDLEGRTVADYEFIVDDGSAPRAQQEKAVEAAAEIAGPPSDAAPATDAPLEIASRETGKSGTVTTPAGRDIEVEYRVVEASDLTTSNFDDGRVNPDYPKELQPRDRSRAASQDQVRDIAARINPRLLGEGPSTTDGAPIVSAAGVVESGNGRTLALRRAYGMDNAGEYRQWLADQGYDIEGMQEPVLVRVRRTDMTPDELVEYTRESNERTTLEMSATEQAMADADALGPIIEDYKGGDINSAANRDFVRKFVRDVVGRSERGGMADAQGHLSQEGRRRVEAALLAAAYGDPGLVTDVFESVDTEIKAIGGALLDAAGRWAQMRQASRENAIADGLDVTPNLIEAVNTIRRARSEGRPLSELVATDDMFGGRIDPRTEAFLRIFYRGDALRRARGRDKVAEALNDYANRALESQPGDGLFGDNVTADQLVGSVNERLKRQEEAGQNQSDLFGARTRPAARDAGEPGGERQGPLPEAVRQPAAEAARTEPEQSGALSSERIPLNEGDRFYTVTGRVTEPFPRGNYKRESLNQQKLRQWLKDEAVAEAESRGDNFNRRQFESLDVKNWSPADGDSVNEYLFGDPEGRIGSRKVVEGSQPPANTPATDEFVEQTKRPQSITRPIGEASQASDYGASNKLVSRERADELRKRLRSKLGQINAGIDPEILAIGAELAAFHIEAGARKFLDFARAIADDLGTNPADLRRYLRGWYNGARDMMEDSGIDVSSMDNPDAVRADLNTLIEEADNAERAAESAQRDRPADEAPAAARDLPDAGRGEGGRGAAEAGTEAGEAGRGAGDAVGDGGAAAAGERGNKPVPSEKSRLERSAARDTDDRGSLPDSTGGLLAERKAGAEPGGGAVAAPASIPKLNVGEGATATAGDLAQVKEQMPFLTDGQAEDVVFAERRLSKPDGFGVLFTNSTGTGKTFSALGIVKRMAMGGKGNILVAVPKQTIADSWIKAADKFFGLPISRLESTQDAGKGIVVTTFANLGENQAVLNRDWDAVVADEAHYLSSDQKGSDTKALDTMRAMTLKRGTAQSRVYAQHQDKVAKMRDLYATADVYAKSDNQQMWDQVDSTRAKADAIRRELEILTEKEKARVDAIPDADKPRAVFLSATPFSYEKSVQWANEFLFDWGTDQNGLAYNSGGNFERFMMQHFGYRMRYNKLTEPDAKVDRGLMQRAFNTWLKREGVLSGRALDSDFDYDRRFIYADNALGRRVDEAIEWIRERSRGDNAIQGMEELQKKLIDDNFDYHSRMYFLEAIKAREAVPHIRDHVAKGRKVLVMHDFKKGGAVNPFRITPNDETRAAYEAFKDEFSDLINAFSHIPSPIDLLSKEFPDALVYNGSVSAKKRVEMQDRFNSDADGAPRVMIAQGDAMREGVSIHDTTGKAPRVMIHLGMPVKPTAAIQQEGRIYRTGQASDAMFRYLTIGSNWERFAFASKIAGRASAAENLAMGEQARGLKEAFINAYENAGDYPAGFEGEGKGGRAEDSAYANQLTPWDMAKSFYFGTKKQGKGRAARGREHSEFFATPEPLGLKMVQWADIRGGEKTLEPSAGHGAIARWLPENTENRAIELTRELSSRLALHFDGDLLTGDFMDHNIVNKYDAIVMNPPFGQGGKQAAEHVEKAMRHLRDGGRIVALVPTGPAADKRFDALLNSDAAKDIYLAAEIKLPAVTFERAGTGVATRVLVLEKQTDADRAAEIQQSNRDYSNVENIEELFDRLENSEIKPRVKPDEPEAASAGAEGGATAAAGAVETWDATHTKTGDPVYMAKPKARLDRDQYMQVLGVAKQHGGYWSRFGKAGFLFKSAEDRQAFVDAMSSGRPDVRYSIAPPTDSAAFKRWFGDSKVVDEDGQPLVVYHGTKSDVSAFQLGRSERRDSGWFGDGFYMTGSPDLANSYAMREADYSLTERPSNVMPLYVRLESPYRINLSDLSYDEGSNFTKKFGGNEGFKRWLSDNGYDGVIGHRDPEIAGQGAEHWEIVVFRPEQIKSATGNTGAFDPENPDIRYSATESDGGLANSAALDQRLRSGTLGRAIGRLIDSGRVVLHDTAQSMPGQQRNAAALTTMDGTIHLAANMLTENSALPVLMHEAFHSGAERLIGTSQWDGMMKRLGSLYRQGERSTGRARQFWDEAAARVQYAERLGVEMGEKLRAEEFGAYAVEQYESAPQSVRRWIDDMAGMVKAWAQRLFGVQIGRVTPAQLRALAAMAIRSDVAARAGIRTEPAFSAGDQTTTPEFRRWFGDSAVVDESGQPLVVYHGTNAEFTEFDPAMRGSNTGWDNTNLGFFFIADRDLAENFLSDTSGGDRIMDVYLSIQKPLRLTTQEIFNNAEQAPTLTEIFFGDRISDPAEALEAINEEIGLGEFGEIFESLGTDDARAIMERDGYDGVFSDFGAGNVEYIAFRPEQVKSATGNTGAFDPNNPDIRYSIRPEDHFTDLSKDQKSFLSKIGPRTFPQRMGDRWRELTDNLALRVRQAGVDRYAALLRNDQALLGEDTLEGSIASSAWVLARMSEAAGGALTAMVNAGRIYLDPSEKVIDVREGTKGFAETMRQLGSPAEIDRFMAWVAANRSHRLAQEGRENLFTADEIKAGMKLGTGKTDDGKSRGLLYAKVWGEFQQFRDDVLGIAEQAGIITPEQRETWAEEFYVPFYRVLDEDNIGGPRSGSGLSRQQAYKRLKGGKSNLNDLMENTLLNFHHLIQSSLKNQAALQAVDNALALQIAQKTTEARRDKKASTFIMRAGEKEWYDISDTLTFKALSALSDAGMNNTAMKIGRAFKRFFTNMITVTPKFVIANTLRDTLSAIATSPASFNPVRNAIEGAITYGNDFNRARMLASGGAFSFGHVYGRSADDVKAGLTRGLRNAKVLSDPKFIPRALVGTWRKWNDVTDYAENVNRAAIWKQNQERGKLKAAFESRDLVDFSARGDAVLIRILTDLVPFLNARIQGLDKLYRSGIKTGAKVAAGKGNKADRLAFARFAAVVGALSAVSIGLYLMNYDDDEYRKLEDWQRDSYWVLRIGDNMFFIPKPFEVGAIATMAERATEQFVDDKVGGRKFAERLGHMLSETFSFDPIPQAVKPLYELSVNRNTFTGRPIEGLGDQRLSPSLRTRPETSNFAEYLSRGMEGALGLVGDGARDAALSPLQIDHLIAGYTGDVGSFAAATADTLWRRAMGEEQPARHWYEYQPIKRFYRDLTDAENYNRYGTLFYDTLKQADRSYADLRRLEEYGELERAYRLEESQELRLAMRQQLNRVSRSLGQINREMRHIRMDKDMSGEAKRLELDRLRSMRNLILEEVGKEIEEQEAARR